jgi:hypothetical protein
LALNSLASFIAKGIAPFRVPFKVPFNVASINPQVMSDEEGPTLDKTTPSCDTDDVVQKDSIDLTEQDDEALPCGSGF